MALLIAAFVATLLGCSARLTLRPDNVAALQGTEAAMKCSSDSSDQLMWRVQWNTAMGMRTIYTGNKINQDVRSLYRISIIKGEVNLVVRATEATAKTYFCEEPHPSGESASADLIVLGEVLLECHSLSCYSCVCDASKTPWLVQRYVSHNEQAPQSYSISSIGSMLNSE